MKIFINNQIIGESMKNQEIYDLLTQIDKQVKNLNYNNLILHGKIQEIENMLYTNEQYQIHGLSMFSCGILDVYDKNKKKIYQNDTKLEKRIYKPEAGKTYEI